MALISTLAASAMAVIVLAVAVLMAGVFLWQTFGSYRERLLFVGLIFLLGAARMSSVLPKTPLEMVLEDEGKVAIVAVGTLKTESVKGDSCTLILKQATVWLNGEEYQEPFVMVWTERESWEEMLQHSQKMTGNAGIQVRVKGRAEAFEGARNPGEFDYALYYKSQRLSCRIRADSLEHFGTGNPPLWKAVSQFRAFVSETLSALCGDEDRGIFEAVLAGNKAELSEDIRVLYQKNGIAHLLAVSGLHVSLIGMGFYGILRRSGLGYGWAGLLSTALLLFYGCVTGFGPSVFRAILMITCSFFAAYLGRTYDLLSALSFALVLLAISSPFLLFTSGLQLSFGAVFSIAVASEVLSVWKKEANINSYIQNFLTSLFIQILTYPIILYHFFEFPVYGIFLNLLVIPFMAYVAASGIASLFLYGTYKLFRALPFFYAAAGAMGTGHYILAFYNLLCRLAETLPFYSLTVGRPSLVKIFLYYGMILWAAFPNSRALLGKKTHFFAVSALAVFLISISPVRDFQITFLDVGQGDGIVMQTGSCNILVDGGSSQVKNLGKQRLVPFLKCKGISELDYVFVSHGDLDHISGVQYLLEEPTGIGVKNIVFSGMSREDKSCQRLSELAVQKGTRVWYMEAGQVISQGDLSLTAVYPPGGSANADKNEQSLVLLVRYGDFSMLLTGDVEQEGEQWLSTYGKNWISGRITVLKVAHHGSGSSTGSLFLKTVQPKIAVLSYGEGNSYGHPASEVVAELRDVGAEILRTAESGAITMVTDGKKLRIKGYRRNR